MTDDEFSRFGLGLNAEPGDAGGARRYFRTFDDKANRAPAADGSDWYRIESVDLPNGEGDNWIGDSVGVATRYYPPTSGAAEPIAQVMAADVQMLIAQSEWRESEKAESWAGKAVAQALGLDANDKGHRVRIRAVLKDMLTNGMLAREERPDSSRRKRWWIIVGRTPPARPNTMANSQEGVPAPVCAPVQTTTGGPEHDGSLAVLRSSESPLGDHCSGAERAASPRGAKTTRANAPVETVPSAPGQTTITRVASDRSELL